MPDRKTVNVPFDSDDPAEQELWAGLQELPREAPSAEMRRAFYRELERKNTLPWTSRIGEWLGINGNTGWLTAAACLLVGVGVGLLLNRSAQDEPMRLDVLEQNIALLNRELILDRLQDTSPSTRLRGVIDAGGVVQEDVEVVRALLMRATEDRVYSVRSAAIDTLGPKLNTAAVGSELMNLLESSESPLVQLALVDMVLRNGGHDQLQQLLQLADSEQLHPDLIRHVNNSIGSETI